MGEHSFREIEKFSGFHLAWRWHGCNSRIPLDSGREFRVILDREPCLDSNGVYIPTERSAHAAIGCMFHTADAHSCGERYESSRVMPVNRPHDVLHPRIDELGWKQLMDDDQLWASESSTHQAVQTSGKLNPK
jgi:hypothetical protein